MIDHDVICNYLSNICEFDMELDKSRHYTVFSCPNGKKMFVGKKNNKVKYGEEWHNSKDYSMAYSMIKMKEILKERGFA